MTPTLRPIVVTFFLLGFTTQALANPLRMGPPPEGPHPIPAPASFAPTAPAATGARSTMTVTAPRPAGRRIGLLSGTGYVLLGGGHLLVGALKLVNPFTVRALYAMVAATAVAGHYEYALRTGTPTVGDYSARAYEKASTEVIRAIDNYTNSRRIAPARTRNRPAPAAVARPIRR